MDYFLQQAGSRDASAVDVAGLVGVLVDLKGRGQAMALPVVGYFGIDCIMDPLLALCEHKAKSKAVPALELFKTILTKHVLSGRTAHAAVKTTATAAQMSDQTIRKAALECLVMLHSQLGEAVLDNCSQLMRAPILASLKEMIAASPPIEVAKRGGAPSIAEKENARTALPSTAPVAAHPIHVVTMVPPAPAPSSSTLSQSSSNGPAAMTTGSAGEAWTGAISGLSAASWKDRLTALERLSDLAPKCNADQAGQLLEELVKLAPGLANDSHSVVVAKSVALLGFVIHHADIAKISTYSKRICLLLLDRLKDNNKTLLTASEQVLYEMLVDSSDLPELVQAIMAATVPKQRQRGLMWVEHLLVENSKQWLRPAFRSLVNQAGEAFNDNHADVRKAAASLLQLLAGKWGRDHVGSVLFGEQGVASRVGATRQAQMKKLVAEAPELIDIDTSLAEASPVASPVSSATQQQQRQATTPTPVKARPVPETQIPVPRRAPTTVVAPGETNLKVPSSIMPALASSASTAASSSVAAASRDTGNNGALEEWCKMSAFVETQIRNLAAEQAKSAQLAQRLRTLESENAMLRSKCSELEEMAIALEDQAVEMEEQFQQHQQQQQHEGLTVEQIDGMSLQELSSAEARQQELLSMIVQRKTEQMLRKNGCTACGKPRAKSTALFPCRHVVCSACGAREDLKQCPDCQADIKQRFELAD